jgi:formylglycine-generating enzyme required for sulfatase activity
VYPVTVGQFAAFVKDADYKTEAEQPGAKATWRDPGFVQTVNDPVVCVSWNDAERFCEWLSRKEKKTYGLPTEAQWEYACRAGTTTAYSFDDPKDLGDYAWYGRKSGMRTHPVGGKKPNPWGLYDMHGNVWEWCKDYYDPKYYRTSPNKDPQNLLEESARVLRGGSWLHFPPYCYSAFRNGLAPGSRFDFCGCRVALCLD